MHTTFQLDKLSWANTLGISDGAHGIVECRQGTHNHFSLQFN
jgi:hypothetical protein